MQMAWCHRLPQEETRGARVRSATVGLILKSKMGLWAYGPEITNNIVKDHINNVYFIRIKQILLILSIGAAPLEH